VGNSELGYTEVILPEGWNNENEVVVKGAYAILSKMKNSEEEGHGH
jgi:membrane fusion protein, heavy metal efflux system